MSGLVLELQADALNRTVHVSDLLRKALVVSRKLGVKHIEDWLEKELRGYGPEDEIPSYREVRGSIKVWNPYHGWQPLNFHDAEMGEKLSQRSITQPIGELDEINARKSGGHLEVPFPEHIKNRLMALMEVPLNPTLHIAYTEVTGILDAARNSVLNFALELEEQGILGDGMSFSKEEKTAASQVTYHVTNNIGSMQNSQIQQNSQGNQSFTAGSDLTHILSFIHELKNKVDALSLDKNSHSELQSELTTIEIQSQSPKPKTNIIKESLLSVRTILEGAAGNMAASALLPPLSALLARLS